MKDMFTRLINALFNEKADDASMRPMKKPKIVWHKPSCKSNPLEPPKSQRPILGQRVTPSWIEEMDENEIFVFGSNTRGIHDGGASFAALQYFGAIVGQAEGIQGRSYAIPTDGPTLTEIEIAVTRFIAFAKAHPNLTFLVTEIGCGTAGYHPMEIAPFFVDAMRVPNIYLPKIFWKFIV